MTSLPKKPAKDVDVFWAEIAACDHCLQIYENDDVFLAALEAYAGAGLQQGEAVILIATSVHLKLLEERLARSGFDLAAAAERDQYIALDAAAAIDTFVDNGWPDEQRFNAFVFSLLERARPRYPKVRAFGEMVALLWAKGHCGATIRLEHLWARMCQSERFSLFCAYPRGGFTQNAQHSMMDVHLAHSVVFNAA
ncbi:MEDS domain-containing protein [Massilia sp. CF038]|uniref:MEDS domain-containing protein n=1 Tax=Massilia sp. CF038 TaxID=1881045 RepID=UPI0009212297|nr:MEDS domain-containing protein [Massilia sp. CF038]SHG72235.1 MEDS: MEthanogen/methylotroph, DcmR Sensory domain [Massilia sp. CF038]